MTLHEAQLVAYTAGAVIHGALAVLVIRVYRHTPAKDRFAAAIRIAVCLTGFFWHFGNLWHKSGLFHPIIGNLMWFSALMAFPLLLSVSLHDPTFDSGLAKIITKIDRLISYPQAIFTTLGILSAFQFVLGARPLIDPQFAIDVTMNMLLFYIASFVTLGIIRRRKLRATGDLSARRDNRMLLVLMPISCAVFLTLLYYPGGSGWIELAAGMTTIPSTIRIAYRLYGFPFMDAFIRETLTGIMLLVTFCIGMSIGPQGAWWPLWISTVAMGIALARAPLSRWVDRTCLGYGESAEQQEERVGDSIRKVTVLETFDTTVSEILREEVDADWAKISTEPAAGAAATFLIPDSPPLTLSLGPRTNGRTYMSRQLRLLRTSVLQIGAQRQRLQREDSERRNLIEQHQLREITSRAQMKALQAQINPHFFFNTLNTLAALIDNSPEKAEKLTESLADVFRYALDSTRVERVTLDQELTFLESYLAIEKARFNERLSYSFEVDPAARKHLIPPMILQPLVENAVRHGIGQKLEGGSVRVIARVNADTLTLCVEDTGVGFVRERPGGVGLTNTRDRIKHAYGDASEFRIEAVMPEGTRMVIVLKQSNS
jgi:signal transduction histidine kinase